MVEQFKIFSISIHFGREPFPVDIVCFSPLLVITLRSHFSDHVVLEGCVLGGDLSPSIIAKSRQGLD